jgi:ligand-binding sensor domain-containing protein
MNRIKLAALCIVLLSVDAFAEVQALAQTPDGKIWIARETEMLIYENGKATAVEMQGLGGTVEEMAADPTGGLIIATDQGVFLCKDQSCRKDTRLPEGFEMESMAVDSKGTLWASTRRATGYFHNAIFQPVLPVLAQALAFDEKGVLWAGSGHDLIRWENGKSTTYSLPPPPANVRMAPPITSLLPAKTGEVYVGTRIGLFVLSQQDIKSLYDLDVQALMQDREGAIWIATVDGLKKLQGALTDVQL